MKTYNVRMLVYVRHACPDTPPSRRDIENKISNLLLAMPRLDEGASWDVAATSIPGEDDETERSSKAV